MKNLINHIKTVFIFKRLFCFLLLCIFCSKAYSQSSSIPEYQLKAVFLFHFSQFIDWPPSAFNSSYDPFIIGIIGNDPFGKYLDETVEGEMSGTRPIIIRRFDNIKEIGRVNILYINTPVESELRSILEYTKEKNILTVSDKPNFALTGGVIGFYKSRNKIRIQINTQASKNADLAISSKLLKVAMLL